MNKLKVAVTGGIGSGKSTVIDIISSLGYPTLSADKITRDLYNEKPVILGLVSIFGKDILKEDKIDKDALSKIVFSNKEKLSLLNDFFHPIIIKKLFKEMEVLDSKIVFAEVPLLFECNLQREFDEVLIIMRDEDKRIDSVALRDNTTREKVVARIKNQINYENLSPFAHTYIYNDGDLSSLINKVKKEIERLEKMVD